MMPVSPRHSMLCHAVTWQKLACCTLWRAVAHCSEAIGSLLPLFVLFFTKNHLGSVPFTRQPTRPNWERQISHKHGTKPTSNTFSRCTTISKNNDFKNKPTLSSSGDGPKTVPTTHVGSCATRPFMAPKPVHLMAHRQKLIKVEE